MSRERRGSGLRRTGRPPGFEPLAEELAAGLEEELLLTADWIREHRFEAEGSPKPP